MLNRVRLSLISPQSLVMYQKDSIFRALGYIAFFAVLMSTALFISVLNYEGIEHTTKDAIVDAVVPLEDSCAIVEGSLACESEGKHVFLDLYNATYTLDYSEQLDTSDYQGFVYHFVLHDDALYFIMLGEIVEERLITDLHPDVHNLDLNFDEDSEAAFFEAVFAAVDQELVATKSLWGSLLVITRILFNFMLFNLFILINTLLTNMRLKKVKFKQLYVMMSYAATLLFIVLIFHEMLSAVIEVSFVLLIIALFISFRQMNRLAMELYVRDKKQ